jgi:hypothetical protein
LDERSEIRDAAVTDPYVSPLIRATSFGANAGGDQVTTGEHGGARAVSMLLLYRFKATTYRRKVAARRLSLG